ncbi:M48 family metallopeptidase [Thioalkalivibrio sp. ALJT]|uniref:M48 family metallopeptidase n=1 Tax=Thioalkalivibrio sp. ALJT TaxID=1158146 RepID=UPI00037D971E|nr:M48 family metalloprotease [Thioalkalivibrio sp. ALJT]
MNFFEHQDRAQRRTRGLLVLFALAVLAIVLVMNAIVLVLLGQGEPVAQGEPWLTRDFLAGNVDVMVWTSVLTLGLIGLGSLYRTIGLRDGGGAVARELGGTRVDGDTRDPLRRRLVNVVEEIAIASGVPVPEIYVLEQESGINAFAAGYSPDDAAIAVTRGALEQLDRDELQGVVAHEFGHILNGDMRLNIRLMGMLFGILLLALIGQRMLLAMRLSRNNRNAGGIVAAGVALMVVGYIGLFFGRWIRASVSRQREYLADASAVQFTRQPAGIAGALKKIGASQGAMRADTEEVGHMLFASGALGQMFATHPPLVPRIQAIEPGFQEDELATIRQRMEEDAQARRAEREAQAEAEAAAREAAPAHGPGGLLLDPTRLVDQIGDPGLAQILGAGLLVASMPGPLERAAHSDAWGVEVLLYLLISPDQDVRDAQLLQIAKVRGGESETRVRNLLDAVPELQADLRIPLLEMSFPVLRHRPREERLALEGLIAELIRADGRVSPFEYATGLLLRRQLRDLEQPDRARPSGRAKLARNIEPAQDVLAILARHGHPGDAVAARAAVVAGLTSLTVEDAEAAADQALSRVGDGGAWHQVLDTALEALDGLRPADKQALINAMLATITHGGQTVIGEVELLRAIAGALHVPLPLAELPAADAPPAGAVEPGSGSPSSTTPVG